jgi:hypothetical protein
MDFYNLLIYGSVGFLVGKYQDVILTTISKTYDVIVSIMNKPQLTIEGFEYEEHIGIVIEKVQTLALKSPPSNCMIYGRTSYATTEEVNQFEPRIDFDQIYSSYSEKGYYRRIAECFARESSILSRINRGETISEKWRGFDIITNSFGHKKDDYNGKNIYVIKNKYSGCSYVSGIGFRYNLSGDTRGEKIKNYINNLDPPILQK